MDLFVSCRVIGGEYKPEISETPGCYILRGGFTRFDDPVEVGEFVIPKVVTHVELRADSNDFYLVEVKPSRGWLGSKDGAPSTEILVNSG